MGPKVQTNLKAAGKCLKPLESPAEREPKGLRRSGFTSKGQRGREREVGLAGAISMQLVHAAP